ncbi:hypothetical protein J8M20_24665 [Pseudoalteromonas luteoviolacea]|uniref:hypothetical protein n=1 Tax=Pseudoalteromonas luteoviolacea TaxID=43657 RepID=UPI001B38AB1F|nr:hypothetical protein [Pseudoalteromonas luteoviolacea]MBQ4814580.1 hypothetical protein [Pseudoalteromonas luteoviolacea]
MKVIVLIIKAIVVACLSDLIQYTFFFPELKFSLVFIFIFIVLSMIGVLIFLFKESYTKIGGVVVLSIVASFWLVSGKYYSVSEASLFMSRAEIELKLIEPQFKYFVRSNGCPEKFSDFMVKDVGIHIQFSDYKVDSKGEECRIYFKHLSDSHVDYIVPASYESLIYVRSSNHWSFFFNDLIYGLGGFGNKGVGIAAK